MRCPECKKFRSTDIGDPEIELDLTDNVVAVSGRLVASCVECSTEMKQATLDFYVELPDGWRSGHCCDAELSYTDETFDSVNGGLLLTFTLVALCGGDEFYTQDIEQKISDADFEELC